MKHCGVSTRSDRTATRRLFDRLPKFLRPSKTCAGFLLLFAAIPTSDSQASVSDTYGYGSRSAALAGATVAWGFEGYAATSNPAGLSLQSSEHPDQRLIISWGLIDMVPSFTPIHGVVVENSYTSDKTPARSGDVDVSYRETFGQLLGIAYVVAPETARLSLGLTLFLPINQLAYFDSGEAFQPEYFLYRSSTLRPQLDLGIGAEAAPGLHFGAGLHVGFGQTVNGSLFLQSNTTQPSSFRIGASLKPKVSPYFGVLANPSDSLSLGAVVRLPLQTSNDITLKSGFQLVGTLTGLDINFVGLSALYSDPLSIEIGTSWKYLDSARLFLQADYQAWSKYQVPSISIQGPTTNDCQGTACGTGVRISPSRNPTFAFKDIVVPRIGHEWTLGRLSLRAGYAYRPSILKDIPTGPGNYLDPPKHHLNAGAGYRFDHFLHFEVPCSLDFHASYDLLVTQTVVKTPGNEAGDPTEAKIGSPGYEAGGKIYGGGISLTLAF